MQYVEVLVPTPKKDEVLIKVEAASLSPIDFLIQQGGAKPMFPRELPQIPGIFLFYSFTWILLCASKLKELSC